jgi:predicted PhzF superfamily epimerase YddE/YHI9
VKLPLYRIDAFTGKLFAGNPAAVCPLEEWLPDRLMQSIAAENGVAETAFFVREGKGYRLRWFTPACEVDLCGHATLATAFVIFEYLDRGAEQVRFETQAGELRVKRSGELLTMDMPARPPQLCQPLVGVAQALGKAPRELWASRDYMAVFDSEDEVRALVPYMRSVAALDRFALIVTAPGKEVDFVSRFFAPAQAVDEDPVTGSSHCTLVPYWAQRLGKKCLHALQVSSRGGELWCELQGDRVIISGHAVRYMEGTMYL